MSSQPCSAEIAHAEDYELRHGNPHPESASVMPRPPQGMCFLCHREPVLPEKIECLHCCIKADLNWVECQKLPSRAEIAGAM